jgi:mono/diheme cytochrome c family protein
MQSISKKKLGRVGLVTFLLVAMVAVATQLRATRTIDAPYPDVQASRDPAVLERGRYLVEGPAHCGECHAKKDPPAVSHQGRPLIGGGKFELPIGTFYIPNITPDIDTGIGRYTDRELARLFRFGIKPNGQMALPFMPYANMSDDDLRAIISYLRVQKPVRHELPQHDVNPLGKLVLAFVLAPKGPTGPIKKSIPAEATPAYGNYLAHDVGNCVMCHTKVDKRSGAFAGPIFGGGAEFDAHGNGTKKYLSPNLTPDPRWGWLYGWDEVSFVARFRAGRLHSDSPMPWEAFQGMTDDDLRALYRYFKTLPPAAGGPDPRQRQVIVAIE